MHAYLHSPSNVSRIVELQGFKSLGSVMKKGGLDLQELCVHEELHIEMKLFADNDPRPSSEISMGSEYQLY